MELLSYEFLYGLVDLMCMYVNRVSAETAIAGWHSLSAPRSDCFYSVLANAWMVA